MFLPDIDAFARCLTKRLLPTFESVGEEADRVEQEAWDRPSYSEDTDPADLAEQARNEAITFVQMMESIRQGLINMFAASLWHALEQKLLLLHRRELLDREERGNPKLWSLDEIKKRFKAAGVDIETFSSWSCVDELRLLANTVKHADGYSCEELKARHPDLFVPPTSLGHMMAVDEVLRDAYLTRPVFEPILGESVYVTQEQFEGYAKAVQAFLEDLAHWLECGRRPEPG
jgi:hypothetical protein